MILSIVIYLVILAVLWAYFKNWPQRSTKVRKLMIWSPVLRIVMMLWLSSCLWNITYFNGLVHNGFSTVNYDLEHPKVKGKGNIVRRILVGLDTRFVTNPLTIT